MKTKGIKSRSVHHMSEKLHIYIARKYLHMLKTIGGDRGMRFYANTIGILPGFDNVRFSKDLHNRTLVSVRGEQWHLPYSNGILPTKGLLFMLSVGLEEWIRTKYRFQGFVEVEEGDTVIDCGGFIGAFSKSIAASAGRVFIFEPSPVNFEAVKDNLSECQNVKPLNLGLFNNGQIMEMNLSKTCVDDSLLEPDMESTGEKVQVNVVRLDEWARENNVEKIDFLKLEAEGVENEILEGAENILIRKIAADASPERNGKSNAEDLKETLRKRGYEIRERSKMVFARLKD